MKKKKAVLKAKAAFYARPLETRPMDMAKLKERQTLRAEHIAGQAAMHKKYERERIATMLNQNITPQLRATLIKNSGMLK
jgi:hypothetical protein